MITFPNAKINLGLNIVEKRNDGYHNIETIFYPIPLCDVLEITDASATSLTVSGIAIDANTNDNLVMKAYNMLRTDFSIPDVAIHLIKNIPSGAGLGGGSADAAFTITLLNQKFDLKLNEAQLMQYASRLGADCAFFVKKRPSYGIEKGDKLSDINITLSDKYIYLIKPTIHVSTAEAYAHVTPHKAAHSLYESIINLPLEQWRSAIKNDFEESVFIKHPEIQAIKEQLYQLGAVYAAMSGSGAAVFGIFNQMPPAFQWDASYFTFVGKL